jgi:preprotein translocase subunit Sss1
MSPMSQPRGGRFSPPSNEYTMMLAIAVGVLLATIGYVTYACYMRYDTIFGLR